jgi:3'(2'), 5'-bisphosphate nucleotidase
LNKIYFGFNSQAFYVRRIPDIYSLELLLKYINQNKIILPIIEDRKKYIIIASRTHLSNETIEFIEKIKKEHQNTEIMNIGSSLKFCLIAEGLADIYPRFSPTMEWDAAAGHAIVEAAGGSIMQVTDNETLKYNKENLFNPSFIVKIN